MHVNIDSTIHVRINYLTIRFHVSRWVGYWWIFVIYVKRTAKKKKNNTGAGGIYIYIYIVSAGLGVVT